MELQSCLEWAGDPEEVELMEEVVNRKVDEEINRKDSVKQIQISRVRNVKGLNHKFQLI